MAGMAEKLALTSPQHFAHKPMIANISADPDNPTRLKRAEIDALRKATNFGVLKKCRRLASFAEQFDSSCVFQGVESGRLTSNCLDLDNIQIKHIIQLHFLKLFFI